VILINSVFELAPMPRLLDAFPRNGDLLLLPTVLVSSFIGTLCAGGLLIVGSMVADVKDENELPTGHRNEGVFFGAYSLADKTAAGLGHLLAGIALYLVAFQAAAGAVVVVCPENVRNLVILFAPGGRSACSRPPHSLVIGSRATSTPVSALNSLRERHDTFPGFKPLA
jgi:Na+/melibiose symporter-like transporter